MNHLRSSKMNRDVLELLSEYPEMIDKLNNDYKVDLLKKYSHGIDSDILTKTEHVANLYNKAKELKITQPLKPLMEILDAKLSTVNRRLHMAREAGLVVKISGNQE